MDVIYTIFKFVAESFSQAIYNIFSMILPKSPFESFISFSDLNAYMKYINYFLPVDAAISILQAWTVAVALWYLASLVVSVMKSLSGEITPM